MWASEDERHKVCPVLNKGTKQCMHIKSSFVLIAHFYGVVAHLSNLICFMYCSLVQLLVLMMEVL